MLIEYEYRKWLIGVALDLTSEYGSYRELYTYLYSRAFYSLIELDRNRERDGIRLRYQFCDEHPWLMGRETLLSTQCNVLELMVGLAYRCESTIMSDPELGDRTGEWLQTMVVSLGLRDEVDGYFDEQHCEEVIDTFIDRRYSRNGAGGLFTVNSRSDDLRRVEIWYQMGWYLNELMGL